MPALSYFGAADEIASYEAQLREHAAPDPGRPDALVALAWHLRQRDTTRALLYADEATSLLAAASPPRSAALRARLDVARAEAYWLTMRLDEARALALAADAQFATLGDFAGAGDAQMVLAAILDQSGGDAVAAFSEAKQRYERDGDALCRRMPDLRIACVDVTAHPEDAVARWSATLAESAALHHAGLDPYIEAFHATLAHERGEIFGHDETNNAATQTCTIR